MEKYGVVAGEKEQQEEDLKKVLDRQKKHNKARVADSGAKKPKGPSKHRVKSKR